jgi:hypothetical protein
MIGFYLRQIGGAESADAFNLALDFHDNGNDARFCIRNVNSAVVGTDIETEVFTGKHCNISCTGTLTVTGATTINNNMTINGDLYLKNNTWHRSVDGVFRKYYATNEISYYCCGGNSRDGHR